MPIDYDARLIAKLTGAPPLYLMAVGFFLIRLALSEIRIVPIKTPVVAGPLPSAALAIGFRDPAPRFDLRTPVFLSWESA